MSPPHPDHRHVHVIQAVIQHLLATGDLPQLCRDAGAAVLTDSTGIPVTIAAAHHYASNTTFPAATFGLIVELSDGSVIDLGITGRRAVPTAERHLTPPSARSHRTPRRDTP